MSDFDLSGFTLLHTSRQPQIVNFLRDSILSGKLKFGERVVERTLGQLCTPLFAFLMVILSTSRNPWRRA